MKKYPLLISFCLVVVASMIVMAVEPSADYEERPLVLNGLDPVLLVKSGGSEEVAGSEVIALTYQGFVYRFSSEESRDEFVSEPGKYAVVNDRCTMMEGVQATPGIFAVHEGRIYLFGDVSCRARFLEDPGMVLARNERGKMKVAIVIYDGVELLDFAGPGEVFWAAGGTSAFEVFTVAEASRTIGSGAGVKMMPGYTIETSPQPDIVVVPGGNAGNAMTRPMTDWLKEVSQEADVVLSVCNGALVLAEAGLLDGLEATTHHGSIESLKKKAPHTVVHADRRWVDNGKIVTSAGISAGIDASLHIVTRILGKQEAESTARYMEYDWEPERHMKTADAGR